MVPCLLGVISSSQFAFVKGRVIGDNILLAHELVNFSHLIHDSPRLSLKVDLRKAFDSVDIRYLIYALRAMSFPEQFIRWIEGCLN